MLVVIVKEVKFFSGTTMQIETQINEWLSTETIKISFIKQTHFRTSGVIVSIWYKLSVGKRISEM